MTSPERVSPAELPSGPPGSMPAGQAFGSGPEAAPLPAGRMLRTGVLLVVGGILLGIVGFVVAIVRAEQAGGSINRLGVPGTTSGQLEAGTYRVEESSSYGYGSYGYEAPDIEVYDPAGEAIPVTAAPTFRSSTAIATFTVPIDGRYDVAATVPRGADEWDVISYVQVERDPDELTAAYLPWFLLGLIGGTGMAGVGLILVIVAAVQRSRARPKSVPAVAAPGWGPPPMWGAPPPQGWGAPPGWGVPPPPQAPQAPQGWGAPPPPAPGWGAPTPPVPPGWGGGPQQPAQPAPAPPASGAQAAPAWQPPPADTPTANRPEREQRGGWPPVPPS